MKVKIKDYEIERTHGYTGQSSKATLVGYCANAGRHITIVIEEDGCFSDNIANLIQDHENIELEIKITGALPSIRKTLA